MSPTEIEKEIKALENLIKESTDRLSEIKKEHWSFGEDSKQLSCVSISSNYDSWNRAKEESVKRPFYIEANDDYADESIDFSIDDAREIVKYLQEKIEYLES